MTIDLYSHSNANTDWSLIIAVIALVASVVSPIFVAIVNNRHQRKLHQADLKYRYRTEVLAERISLVAEFSAVLHELTFATFTHGIHAKYLSLRVKVFSFAPPEIIEAIEAFDKNSTQAAAKEIGRSLAAYLADDNAI